MKDTKTTKKTALARKRAKAITSRNEAAGVASELAEVLEGIRLGEATRDQHLREIAEKYDQALESDQAKAKALTKRLQTWATKNREKEFGDGNSIELNGHRLRFSKSNGKVTTATGVTQEAAADLIAADDNEAFAEKYSTTKTSLAKSAILKCFREGLREEWAKLVNYGVRFATPEEFEFKANFAEKAEKGGKDE